MSLIEYQAWLPDSDLSAAPDHTFATDDQLVDAGFNPVLWGEGDGFLEIHADDPDTQYLQRRGFIRAVRTDTDEGLFWWILEEGSVKLLSNSGKHEKVIRWDGRGMLYYLDRYKLGQAVWAPGQPFRGSISVFDYWTWINQPMIAILTRFMEEGQFDTRADFLDKLEYDFSRTQDSNGNALTAVSEYQVRIGTGGLQLASDMMRQGNLLQVLPSLPPTLQAFRALSEYRTDRTSATYAANKVRFAAGDNIATELPHKIVALRERSHTLTRRQDGQYATEALNGSGVPYMEYMDVPHTSDPDAVEAFVGESHLSRQKQSTVAVIRHKLGPGGTSGAQGYFPSPAGHYWLGDLVTVHSGTGEYDLNEQTLEVAGLRYFLRGADWMVEAQLGAQVLNASGGPVNVPSGGPTVVNPPIHVCRSRPSTGIDYLMYQDFGTSASTAVVDGILFPAGDDPCLLVFITSNASIGTITWKPNPADSGTDQVITDLVDSGTASGLRDTYVYRLTSPTLPVPGGGELTVGTTARIVGVMALTGYNGFRDTGDAAGAGSLVLDADIGDLVLNIIGGGHSQADNGPTSPPADWTVEYAASQDHGTGDSLGTWQQVHSRYADALSMDLTDLYGSGGSFGSNRHHVGLVFAGGAPAAGSDFPEPTVLPGEETHGECSGVAPCCHQHAHGYHGGDPYLHDVDQLGTSETGTAKVLKPDGSGGVVWGTDETSEGGGGSSHVGEGSGATVVDTDSVIGASPLSVSATVSDGDLMVIAGYTVNSVPNVNGPNNDNSWTLLVRQDTSSNEYHFAYYKVASGESGTWTMTHSAGTEAAMGLVVFRGVDAEWAKGYVDNSYMTPSVLGHAEGLLVAIFFAAEAGSSDLTLPARLTSGIFVETATANHPQVLIAYRDTYAEAGTGQFTSVSSAAIGFAGALAVVFYDA